MVRRWPSRRSLATGVSSRRRVSMMRRPKPRRRSRPRRRWRPCAVVVYAVASPRLIVRGEYRCTFKATLRTPCRDVYHIVGTMVACDQETWSHARCHAAAGAKSTGGAGIVRLAMARPGSPLVNRTSSCPRHAASASRACLAATIPSPRPSRSDGRAPAGAFLE